MIQDLARDEYYGILQRAIASQEAGERERAYHEFSLATELDPDRPEAWRGRAATATSEDDEIVSLGYAHALDQSDQDLRLEFIRRLEHRSGNAKSIDGPALVAIGQKLCEAGLVESASTLFKRAGDLDETLDEAYVWLSATSGSSEEAMAALNQAIAHNPDNHVAKAGIAFLTLERERSRAGGGRSSGGRPAEAQSSPDDQTREGERALAKGDKERAYQLFVAATQKDPKNEDAWLGRARSAEDIDETLTCLEQALAINPENMQAREARTLYRVRKLREGFRSQPETKPQARFRPTFAGGAGFSEPAPEEVRQRRMFLLILMVLVLMLAIVLLYLRMA